MRKLFWFMVGHLKRNLLYFAAFSTRFPFSFAAIRPCHEKATLASQQITTRGRAI
jgi:hypothetical protein